MDKNPILSLEEISNKNLINRQIQPNDQCIMQKIKLFSNLNETFKSYTCIDCDTSNICEFCFESCHTNCSKDSSEVEESEFKKNFCSCALNSHFNNQLKVKKQSIHQASSLECEYSSILNLFNIFELYSYEKNNEKINICFHCANYCLKDSEYSIIITPNINNKKAQCACNHKKPKLTVNGKTIEESLPLIDLTMEKIIFSNYLNIHKVMNLIDSCCIYLGKIFSENTIIPTYKKILTSIHKAKTTNDFNDIITADKGTSLNTAVDIIRNIIKIIQNQSFNFNNLEFTYGKCVYYYFFDFKLANELFKFNLNVNIKLFDCLTQFLISKLPNFNLLKTELIDLAPLMKISYDKFCQIVGFDDFNYFLTDGFLNNLTNMIANTFEIESGSIIYIRESLVNSYFNFLLCILNVRYLTDEQLFAIHNSFLSIFKHSVEQKYNLSNALQVLSEIYLSSCQSIIFEAIDSEDEINYELLKSDLFSIIIDDLLLTDSNLFYNTKTKERKQKIRKIRIKNQYIINIRSKGLKVDIKNVFFKLILSNILQKTQDAVVNQLEYFLKPENEKYVIQYFDYIRSCNYDEIVDTSWNQINLIQCEHYFEFFTNGEFSSSEKISSQEYFDKLERHINTISFFLKNSDHNYGFRFVEKHLMKFINFYEYITNYQNKIYDDKIEETKIKLQTSIINLLKQIFDSNPFFAKMFIECRSLFVPIIFSGKYSPVTEAAYVLVNCYVSRYKDSNREKINLNLYPLLKHLNCVDQPLFSNWNSNIIKLYKDLAVQFARNRLLGYEESVIEYTKIILKKIKMTRVELIKKKETLILSHFINLIGIMLTQTFLQVKNIIEPKDNSFSLLAMMEKIKDGALLTDKLNTLFVNNSFVLPFYLDMKIIIEGYGFEGQKKKTKVNGKKTSNLINNEEETITIADKHISFENTYKRTVSSMNKLGPIENIKTKNISLDIFFDIHNINVIKNHMLVKSILEYKKTFKDKSFIASFPILVNSNFNFCFSIIHFFLYQLLESQCDDGKLFLFHRLSYHLLLAIKEVLITIDYNEPSHIKTFMLYITIELADDKPKTVEAVIEKLLLKLNLDIENLELLNINNCSFKSIFDIMNYYFEIVEKSKANQRLKKQQNDKKILNEEKKLKEKLILKEQYKQNNVSVTITKKSLGRFYDTVKLTNKPANNNAHYNIRTSRTNNKSKQTSKYISNIKLLVDAYTSTREENSGLILDFLLSEKNKNYKQINKNFFTLLIELSFESIESTSTDEEKANKNSSALVYNDTNIERVQTTEYKRIIIDYFSLENLISLTLKNKNYIFLQETILNNSSRFAPKIFDLIENYLTTLCQMFLVGFKSSRGADTAIYKKLKLVIEFLRLLTEGYNKYFQTFLIYFLLDDPDNKPITLSAMLFKFYNQMLIIVRQYAYKIKTFKMSTMFYKDITSLTQCFTSLTKFFIEVTQGGFKANFFNLFSKENFLPICKEITNLIYYITSNYQDLNREHILTILEDYFELLIIILEEYQLLDEHSPVLNYINFKAVCELNYLCYIYLIKHDLDYKESHVNLAVEDKFDFNSHMLSPPERSNLYSKQSFKLGCQTFRVINLYCWLDNKSSWAFYKDIPLTSSLSSLCPAIILNKCESFFAKIIKGVEIVIQRNNYYEPQRSKEYNSFIGVHKLDAKYQQIKNETKDLEFTEKRYLIKIYYTIPSDGLFFDEKMSILYLECLSTNNINENLKKLINGTKYLSDMVSFKTQMINNNDESIYDRYEDSLNNEKISYSFAVLINLFLFISMKYEVSSIDLNSSKILSPYKLPYYLMYLLILIQISFNSYCMWIYVHVMKNYSSKKENYLSFKYIMKDLAFSNKTCILMIFTIFSLIGFLKVFWILPLELVMIYRFSKTISNMQYAIKTKAPDFVSALLLIVFIILFYSSISIYFFGNLVQIENEAVCDSFFNCFFYLLTYGLRAGNGLGFSILSMDSPFYWREFIAEWTFYFFLILLMANIINAIIVDLFQQLNEQESEKASYLSSNCTICGLTKEDLRMRKIGFYDHVLNVHHVYFYIQYFHYLSNLDHREMTITDNLVKKMIDKESILFFPRLQTKGLNLSDSVN